MDTSGMVKHGQENGMEMITGLAEWRQQHPRATLKEIEAELDRPLERFRARLLEEAVSLSEMREWKKGKDGPRCPDCGDLLEKRGKRKRSLQTNGGAEVGLEREYGVCPKCGQGFFPPG
jgi:uncharacterized protein with PIN domain